MEEGILNSIPNTELNGPSTLRLANTSNITFQGIDSEALLILLDQEGLCASSGSACLADSDEPSHVVKAMKPESGASGQMIRFSLDVDNSAEEIRAALSNFRTGGSHTSQLRTRHKYETVHSSQIVRYRQSLSGSLYFGFRVISRSLSCSSLELDRLSSPKT